MKSAYAEDCVDKHELDSLAIATPEMPVFYDELSIVGVSRQGVRGDFVVP